MPVCTEDYSIPKIMRDDPVEAQKRVTYPKFMDMQINLSDISVQLKATPLYKNFIRLQAKSIKISTKPY